MNELATAKNCEPQDYLLEGIGAFIIIIRTEIVLIQTPCREYKKLAKNFVCIIL